MTCHQSKTQREQDQKRQTVVGTQHYTMVLSLCSSFSGSWFDQILLHSACFGNYFFIMIKDIGMRIRLKHLSPWNVHSLEEMEGTKRRWVKTEVLDGHFIQPVFCFRPPVFFDSWSVKTELHFHQHMLLLHWSCWKVLLWPLTTEKMIHWSFCLF